MGKETPEHELTAEELRAALDYDPETGRFSWRSPTSFKMRPGDPAGYMAQGYVRIRVKYRKYLAHRLAWLYVHGEWPKGMLDHANRNPADNRIENLRQANFSTNAANAVFSKVSTLPRGVRKAATEGRWMAQIKVNGKVRHLGTYGSQQEAAEAYRKGAIEAFGEFAMVA